ncbi:MAG: hypothetical protein U1E52_11270 [Geminicoccaceae bacterium]
MAATSSGDPLFRSRAGAVEAWTRPVRRRELAGRGHFGLMQRGRWCAMARRSLVGARARAVRAAVWLAPAVGLTLILLATVARGRDAPRALRHAWQLGAGSSPAVARARRVAGRAIRRSAARLVPSTRHKRRCVGPRPAEVRSANSRRWRC